MKKNEPNKNKKNKILESDKMALAVEEARARHEEIHNYIKQGRQAIFWCLAATGAIWAWIVTNHDNQKTTIFLNFIVFLPLLIEINFLRRWYLLEKFISENSNYLKEVIEPLMPNEVQGWETYLDKNKSSTSKLNKLQQLNYNLTLFLWIILSLSNVIGIILFYSC